MRWLAMPFAAFALACGSAQQQSGYTELTLHGDGIARQIQSSVEGTKCELHADSVDDQGNHQPGCFIQFGPHLKDRRFQFSVPDKVLDLGYAGKITYKVNDVKLDTLKVATSTDEFVFAAAFKSDGVALKGYHSSLGDAAVPDIKLEHMLLTIHLKPTVTPDGKISYDQPKVEFTADVDNTFIPRFTLFGHTIDVINTLTNYRHELCASIQSQIQKALDDPPRKAALSQKLQEGIAGQFGGANSSVLGLRFQGTDLIVRFKK